MHGWAGNGCQLVKLAKNSHPRPLHSTPKAGCVFPTQHSCMLAWTPMKIWHHGRTHIAHGAFFLFFPILFWGRKTATNTAQFGVFQPHRWALPSCELKGFNFCMHARNAMLHVGKLWNGPKNISMAHTGSTFAPNAALGNGVPSLATVKASIDARRPQGCRAGAAAAPAPAPPPSPASAWLRPRGAAQPGEGLHGAAGGLVCRRLVLRAPVPRGRRLRGTRTLRLRHGARVSTHGTCTSTARWRKFHWLIWSRFF